MPVLSTWYLEAYVIWHVSKCRVGCRSTVRREDRRRKEWENLKVSHHRHIRRKNRRDIHTARRECLRSLCIRFFPCIRRRSFSLHLCRVADQFFPVPWTDVRTTSIWHTQWWQWSCCAVWYLPRSESIVHSSDEQTANENSLTVSSVCRTTLCRRGGWWCLCFKRLECDLDWIQMFCISPFTNASSVMLQRSKPLRAVKYRRSYRDHVIYWKRGICQWCDPDVMSWCPLPAKAHLRNSVMAKRCRTLALHGIAVPKCLIVCLSTSVKKFTISSIFVIWKDFGSLINRI